MTLAIDTPVRVRIGRGVENDAVILEDRGSRYRIRYADGHTATVLKERCRPVNVRKTMLLPPRPESPPVTWVSADAAPAIRAVQKPPARWESAEYLQYVRDRDYCACCGRYATWSDLMEASHHGARGMSRKSDDSRAIPLRRSCHRYYHDHGVFRGSDSSEPMTREKTDALAKNAASASLYAYAAADGIDVDNIIIDALTAALRERS